MAIDWPKTQLEVWNEEPLGVKNPKTWSHYHMYGGWGKFFRGLEQKKLLATRCTNPTCGEKRLWLPPRCECPDCWHDMEWVEAPQTGIVYTHSVVKYPGELFKLPAGTPLISIELPGVCTKLMSWLKEGKPQFGMKVKAVFNTERPTHTILDLAWVPA
ncbi:MAG: OB-fold domain-containing protein [Planctomycetota bacterium]